MKLIKILLNLQFQVGIIKAYSSILNTTNPPGNNANNTNITKPK
jgi:hypothetical protein